MEQRSSSLDDWFGLLNGYRNHPVIKTKPLLIQLIDRGLTLIADATNDPQLTDEHDIAVHVIVFMIKEELDEHFPMKRVVI